MPGGCGSSSRFSAARWESRGNPETVPPASKKQIVPQGLRLDAHSQGKACRHLVANIYRHGTSPCSVPHRIYVSFLLKALLPTSAYRLRLRPLTLDFEHPVSPIAS